MKSDKLTFIRAQDLKRKIVSSMQMKILQYLNVGGAELISHVRDRKSMKVSFYGKIQTFLAKIF